MKVTSAQYVQVVKSQLYPDSFFEHLLQNKTIKHQNMNVHIKWNCFDTHYVHFGQVLATSGMELLVTNDWYVGKITTVPRSFFEH